MGDRTLEEIAVERRLANPIEERKYWFDINKDSIVAPKTKNENGDSDIAIVVNEAAVLESVYNILLTEPGEKVMDPLFGCGLDQFLFEPIDDITASRIVDIIGASLSAYEPRLLDYNVVVTAQPDQHTMEIDVYLTINTAEEPILLQTKLEKLR